MTVTSFTVCLIERMVCRKRRRLKKARMELEGELCLPSVADFGMEAKSQDQPSCTKK